MLLRRTGYLFGIFTCVSLLQFKICFAIGEVALRFNVFYDVVEVALRTNVIKICSGFIALGFL